MNLGRSFRTVSSLALLFGASMLLAGCEAETGSRSSEYRAFAPLSPEALASLRAKDSDQNAPMLIRAFKKEAELEVWKQKKDGKYVLFKTYPMCRWSGQLGPKKTEGDRQVPEGFYTITPGQMNPKSQYYLSFNVGYPNAYDRANGRGGGSIMVHGVCSSAGCFSMTDTQIEEIYAVARESFAGGQRAIQMQSFPFRMTADNMAKLRLDPNMPFWKEIKRGSDYFELTKVETPVGVCNKRYVFGASAKSGRFDALSACPPLNEDAQVKSAVAAKQEADDRAVAELVGKGVKPVQIVYADGGQNDEFKTHKLTEVSRPDALAAGPSEIALDDGMKAKPVAVQLATLKAGRAAKLVAAARTAEAPKTIDPIVTGTTAAPNTTVVAAAFTAAPSAFAKEEPKSDTAGLFKTMLGIGAAETTEAAPAVQMQPVAATTPAPSLVAAKPDTRNVATKTTSAKIAIAKTAIVKSQTPVAPKPEQVSSTALPKEITGEPKGWIGGLLAYSPFGG